MPQGKWGLQARLPPPVSCLDPRQPAPEPSCELAAGGTGWCHKVSRGTTVAPIRKKGGKKWGSEWGRRKNSGRSWKRRNEGSKDGKDEIGERRKKYRAIKWNVGNVWWNKWENMMERLKTRGGKKATSEGKHKCIDKKNGLKFEKWGKG